MQFGEAGPDENVPTGQVVQPVDDPASDVLPAGHAVHFVAPDVSEVVPGAQAPHAARPATGADVPGAQGTQVTGASGAAFGAEPAGQAVHAAWPGRAWTLPGGHDRHRSSGAPPMADALLYRPTGHRAQMVDPGNALYDPSGQAAQDVGVDPFW